MDRQILPSDTKPDLERVFLAIFDGTLNTPFQTSVAPTTSNQIVKENQLAFYSGNLYITINGSTYKITLTSV